MSAFAPLLGDKRTRCAHVAFVHHIRKYADAIIGSAWLRAPQPYGRIRSIKPFGHMPPRPCRCAMIREAANSAIAPRRQ